MLRQVISLLMAVLVASQPLGAIAEAHPFNQSGAQHSPLDLLHTSSNSNSAYFRHEHKDHHLAGSDIVTKLSTKFSTKDEATYGTAETPDCGHCSHTHATYSASVASSAPLASLISKQQNMHFYLPLKPVEYSASLYRPPRP